MNRWIWLVAVCWLVSLFVWPGVGEAARKYEANWESLDKRPTPQWWVDAKFGIFIHWGMYSVPAWSVRGQYSERYSRRIEDDKKKSGPRWQYHRNTYGENFPYAGFAPMFKAELHDPHQWADIFHRCGTGHTKKTSHGAATNGVCGLRVGAGSSGDGVVHTRCCPRKRGELPLPAWRSTASGSTQEPSAS